MITRKKEDQIGQSQDTFQRGQGYPRGRGNGGGRIGSGLGKSFICYKCGEEGNKASECPHYDAEERGPARVVLVEEEEEAKIEVTTNMGETLMIRRTLAVPKKVSMKEGDKEDSWLRHNIFRTRCTSVRKVCNMVIDGGSCENLVFDVMVDKLQLKCEAHPTPYHVSWIKKKNTMIIDKRCLISFSIGKAYKDTIWCDVILMDACHILLGRPWQYDRDSNHNGKKNTHTFWKDGLKIVLEPMKEEGPSESLLEIKEFLAKIKGASFCYALTTKKVEEGEAVIPTVVAKLLREYEDVTPEEFLDGLPPKRDIQHHMDLILGSILPN